MKGLKNKIKEKLLNNINPILSKYALILTFIITFNGCDFKVRKGFGACLSSSIAISKQRKTYLWNYKPIKICLYDTINVSSVEIFAEKQYKTIAYDDINYIVNDKESQIIINFDKNLYDKGCSYTWEIKDFGVKSQKRVLGKYNFIQDSDSILVTILRIETDSITGKPTENDGKIINHFVLKKAKL
jgi:hypothetical protein